MTPLSEAGTSVEACGGCGNADPDKRCIGCLHQFIHRCIACDLPLREGDLVMGDASGGLIHAACCGPERDSYVNAEGDPLGPDDPIPTGWEWVPDSSLSSRTPERHFENGHTHGDITIASRWFGGDE